MFLMTGIQTVVNPVWCLYQYILMISIGAFALYDMKCHRVPNKALIPFCIYCLCAIPWIMQGHTIEETIFYVCLGFLLGGGILIGAALLTNGGIGGGDIKFCAILGIVCGPYGILMVLMVATLTAMLAGILQKLICKHNTHLPFLPFILLGLVGLTFYTIFH